MDPGPPARRIAPISLLLGLLFRGAVATVVSIVAGTIVYVVLPMPSAAAPGLPGGPTTPAAAAVLVVPQRTPALVAGIIDSDDSFPDPTGVTTTPPTGPDGPLIGWPVTDHTPSTGFGYRSDPFTHRQRWHDGVDLGQPCNDPVQASLDGTVTYTGWAGGYGNRIIVRHADRNGRTFSTTYNHLSHIGVDVGQAVTRSQVIARIGSTGRSTACHLHFEVILGGSYVDPMRFLTGDQSKASLSRRVGSYMPTGMPSPTVAPTTTRPSSTPTPTATATRTPTPTPTTPAPSTPAPSTPAPSTPAPSTPAASTPAASTPAASTPAPGTPAPGTPAPSTPAATTATPAGTPQPSASTPGPSSTSTQTSARSASPTPAAGPGPSPTGASAAPSATGTP